MYVLPRNDILDFFVDLTEVQFLPEATECEIKPNPLTHLIFNSHLNHDILFKVNI